jgi:CelD/BcsL family acetyltransferase involved in cellulose biosynthesis
MTAMLSEATLASPSPHDGLGVPALRVEITDLGTAAEPWAGLERDCVGSPYQRLDWVRAYVEAGVESETETRIALARDAATGQAVMIMPLALRRGFGLRIASFVGGKHANYNLPLVAASQTERVTDAELRALLLEAGRRLASTLSCSRTFRASGMAATFRSRWAASRARVTRMRPRSGRTATIP